MKNRSAFLIIAIHHLIDPEKDLPDDFISNSHHPCGSRFKGYRDFVVQDLDIKVHNTRYRLERWLTPNGKSLTGKLPENLKQQHFGPQRRSLFVHEKT